MTTTVGSRPAGWRERWARLENERRGRAYQASLAAWQWQQAQYQHRLEVARAFQPVRETAPYAWLRPKRGEAVYWVADGVGMVEPPHPAGLRPPDYREYFTPPAAAGAPAVAGLPADTGQVAVTSQRIIFLGRARREWVYAKLTGLAHTAGGQTLMLVSNRRKVSGVAPRPEAVADFRLHLALALADAAGQRDGFVGQLAEQAARHQQARPPAPVPATAQQAPVSAWLSGGRLAGVVAGSVVLLFFCVVGTALAGNGQGGDDQDRDPQPLGASVSSRSPSPSTPAPSSTPRSASPAASPTGTAVETSPTADPVRRDTPQQPPSAAGDCAAYVDSGGWCVDGAGDYDCEGGSGNGPNYAPRGVDLVEPGVDPFGLDRDGDGEGCEAPSAPAPPPPPPPDSDPDTDPRFGTCGEAIDRGYGPYYRGSDPEYGWYRDADGDGVVCE